MKRNIVFTLTFYIAILCIPQFAAAQTSMAPAGEIYRDEGIASWYGREFEGRPTTSGEPFDSTLFTAAHRELPFGTFLIVTNKNNNQRVTVKINDRGPITLSRIIDLSQAAAEQIGLVSTGIAPVIIETLPSRYFQSPPGTPASSTAPVTPVAPVAIQAPPEPQPPAAVPEPEPEPEPIAQAPQTATVAPGYPYPPITVNVYPSAPPPQPSAQTQAEPQYQEQPQYQPQYQEQPQYQPQYQQYPPQPQYQYQQPQTTYPFPAPVVPSMQAPYQESYLPPPVQPAVESPAPAVRLIPAINPLPGTTYRLQVGSYKVPRNAVDAFEKLKNVGLNPDYEQHGELYRVVLKGIPGTEVMSAVDKLGRAGFREAIIRVEQ
jgi:rare lipoprotein A